jgi:hypothetical protein
MSSEEHSTPQLFLLGRRWPFKKSLIDSYNIESLASASPDVVCFVPQGSLLSLPKQLIKSFTTFSPEGPLNTDIFFAMVLLYNDSSPSSISSSTSALLLFLEA